MRTKLFILILLGSIGIFQFCKVDDGKPDIEAKKYEPVAVPNLITNSSFETGGNVDYTGWSPSNLLIVVNPDANSAPVSNGYFCAKLAPDSVFNVFNVAYTQITNCSGFTEMQLSFYAKTNNCSGFAELRVKRNGYYVKYNRDYNFSFEKWTQRTLRKDTCTLFPTDTIEVAFWANQYAPDSACFLYIDMVKLEKLN